MFKYIKILIAISSIWLLFTFLFAYELPQDPGLQIIRCELTGTEAKLIVEPTPVNKDNKSEESDFVSIVIPLYNQVQFLNETLQSVLKQTFQNYEVIIVNDGSTEFYVESYLSMIATTDTVL